MSDPSRPPRSLPFNVPLLLCSLLDASWSRPGAASPVALAATGGQSAGPGAARGRLRGRGARNGGWGRVVIFLRCQSCLRAERRDGRATQPAHTLQKEWTAQQTGATERAELLTLTLRDEGLDMPQLSFWGQRARALGSMQLLGKLVRFTK
jgi:hypothetical protein